MQRADVVELGTDVIAEAGSFTLAGASVPFLVSVAALGLYALFSDRTGNNDDDDSSPGGGLMQPVA